MTRVRFAPSPTGYLHVGGLRTALYNWAFARASGGKFLLRIEDTDQSRLVEGAVENLLESLRWAGIEPDEGPHRPGEAGPYVQSERLAIYREHVDKLVEKGLAYPCFATPEELEEMREQQKAAGLNPGYDGRYRDYDKTEAQKRIQAGEPHAYRLKVPADENVVFDDIVRGTVSINTSTVDDQVLMKKDGFPTYHLAAVVDDHLMGITHVIRGEEWLSSTPKHILLNRAFGWEPPRYAHLPLIVNEQKKKLSKRDGDVSVESYREGGYSAQGLVNFLALLGWSAGDDKEYYPDLQSIADAFSLERISKSASVFDVAKLKHINFLHLREMPGEALSQQLDPFFEQANLSKPEPKKMAAIIEVMRERASIYPDYVEGCAYFYQAPTEYDEKSVKKRWKEDSPGLLKAYQTRLKECAWDVATLEAELQAVTAAAECGAGRLIHPVRLAVSGVGGGPGLYDLLLLVGREECISRIERAIEALAGLPA
ncbi:MAG: glutamate--tRNA ligase [Vulcanimicrobiota bacterium]